MSITISPTSTFITYTNPNITVAPLSVFVTYNELFPINSSLDCDVTLADPWAMETDPLLGTDYSDSDTIIDADDEIKKLTELKKIKTLSSIKSMNCGLVPKIISPTWNVTRQYFEDSKYTTCQDRYTTAISINNIPNINNFNVKNNYFSKNMYDAYNDRDINAFLLFINEVQIDWSRITIVKSDDYYTLLISNMDNITTNIQEVKLIYIPFEITYTEGEDEPSDGMVLFKFDENGLYGGLHTIIYTKNERIKSLSYHLSSYYNYALALEYTLKITSENLFIFNYEGYFDVDNHSSSIKTTNIATIDDGIGANDYLVCIWSTDAELSEDNSVRALNEPYIKKIVQDIVSSSDFDTSLFETEFDFTHSKSLDYNTNINNSISYIFGYDENKYDDVFKNHKNIDIYEYDILSIMKRAAADSYDRVTMLRNRAGESDKSSTSFPIIFQNGMIPIFYSTINYTENTFTFKPTYLKYTDTFEVVMFRNVNNTLIKLDYSKIKQSDYLNISNCAIPKDELIIYTANRGDNNLCPLNYTINEDGSIDLIDPEFRYTQLYFGSKNQFIYERYTYSSTTNTVILSSKFRTAYDSDKFLIFVNGRLLNKTYYKILIQSLTTTGTIVKAVYSAKTLNSGDRVDIFYCNVTKLNRINTSGDLLIQCSKIKATDNNQSTFNVPYPYTNYPKTYDSFFCIKHSLYVDKAKYKFYGSSSDSTYGNSIQFIDSTDYLNESEDLIFVFPYYSNSSNISINTTNGLNFINRSLKIVSDTDTITLNPTDANDIGGNFYSNSKLMVFLNSTYVDPSRYTVSGTNTIKFNEILNAPKFITIVLEIDTTIEENSGIELHPVQLTATTDNDIAYQLPSEYAKYSSSLLLFKGTVLLSPERYYVDNNNILYLEYNDTSMEAERSMTAVYALANDLSLVNFEYLYIDIASVTTSINIPVGYFINFKFTQNNVLLFVDTTFVDSTRYSINNITKTITVNDSNDTLFKPGKKITIAIAYKSKKLQNVVVNDKETIYFDDRYAEPYDTTSGAYKFNIPWPNLPFTDTEFFITKGASFIPNDRYSVSGSILTYFDTDAFEIGDTLRFTFVHNKEFVDIKKQQVTIRLAPSQTQVSIPSPYYNIINLQNRIILIYGDTVIDQTRYSIDNYNKKINLFDIPYEGDNLRELTILIFYTGSASNGAMAYLPASGYATFIRSDTISNYNKEMYLLFVNGKKVSKSQLLDITNNLIKVQVDINRRYNLEVIDCTPTLKTLNTMYTTQSKWIQLINPLPV